MKGRIQKNLVLQSKEFFMKPGDTFLGVEGFPTLGQWFSSRLFHHTKKWLIFFLKMRFKLEDESFNHVSPLKQDVANSSSSQKSFPCCVLLNLQTAWLTFNKQWHIIWILIDLTSQSSFRQTYTRAWNPPCQMQPTKELDKSAGFLPTCHFKTTRSYIQTDEQEVKPSWFRYGK